MRRDIQLVIALLVKYAAPQDLAPFQYTDIVCMLCYELSIPGVQEGRDATWEDILLKLQTCLTGTPSIMAACYAKVLVEFTDYLRGEMACHATKD